jgi:NADPH:quinone reductase-like Zn-dependent oxidoreductase
VLLGCSTAASAMFQDDFLNLMLPTVPRREANGKTQLIWGGSSSVGCNAVQLAVAAGYEVLTTASPRNFDLVKKLGPSEVFEYNGASIVDDLVGALERKELVGTLDCIVGPAWASCFEVVHRVRRCKLVVTTRPGRQEPYEDLQVKRVWGLSVRDKEVGGISVRITCQWL